VCGVASLMGVSAVALRVISRRCGSIARLDYARLNMRKGRRPAFPGVPACLYRTRPTTPLQGGTRPRRRQGAHNRQPRLPNDGQGSPSRRHVRAGSRHQARREPHGSPKRTSGSSHRGRGDTSCSRRRVTLHREGRTHRAGGRPPRSGPVIPHHR
jgi:hypothetical protein